MTKPIGKITVEIEGGEQEINVYGENIDGKAHPWLVDAIVSNIRDQYKPLFPKQVFDGMVINYKPIITHKPD